MCVVAYAGAADTTPWCELVAESLAPREPAAKRRARAQALRHNDPAPMKSAKTLAAPDSRPQNQYGSSSASAISATSDREVPPDPVRCS
jgi:primosomal protein N''